MRVSFMQKHAFLAQCGPIDWLAHCKAYQKLLASEKVGMDPKHWAKYLKVKLVREQQPPLTKPTIVWATGDPRRIDWRIIKCCPIKLILQDNPRLYIIVLKNGESIAFHHAQAKRRGFHHSLFWFLGLRVYEKKKKSKTSLSKKYIMGVDWGSDGESKTVKTTVARLPRR